MQHGGSEEVVLISYNLLKGVTSLVFLIEKTLQYLPEAEIEVKRSYFPRSIIAKCTETSLYDLILGNVHVAGRIDDPDEEWNRKRPIGSEENKEELSSRLTAEESKTAEGFAVSDKKLRQ